MDIVLILTILSLLHHALLDDPTQPNQWRQMATTLSLFLLEVSDF